MGNKVNSYKGYVILNEGRNPWSLALTQDLAGKELNLVDKDDLIWGSVGVHNDSEERLF
jgi:hypothetical protein